MDETDGRRVGVFEAAAAGLLATLPMTAVMEAAYRVLPREEQYPLPPRQITDRLAEETGTAPHLDEGQRVVLTLASHFGYGAAAGAAYAPFGRWSPLPAPLTGAAYGVGVWAGSYLGWLPALGILRPATEAPRGRVALMVGAHVVWGAALGMVAQRLATARARGRSRALG